MMEYKVLKGTKRTLYLKGLKSHYFYVFCFTAGIGAMLIAFTGLNNGIVLHLCYAGGYIVVLYLVFFYLSLEKPYEGVKKTYSVIQNIDLLKILKK
ncbi:hypothetical protein HCG49_16780 [Arenibacter sp. 6A1]|uniref:hypothetical protein n=1 Tax=Arenibacter sp. 6A1 TaxID=2720391 RepID=UPI0014480D59|nr:hypothetical protein [Arenibacter sp. 6A1]NKI28210.1 hypothetical protein [Arenibacter sp. 6A1]